MSIFECEAHICQLRAKFTRTSREYGVENNAYLTFTRAGHIPRPLLGLLRPPPLWHSVQQPPGGGRGRGGQRSPKCPRHIRVPVRRVRLHHLHLVRPVPQEDFPLAHGDGGDAVRGAGEEQGMVCAHRGAWLHLRGAADVVHHVPVGQPHPSLQSNTQQQQLPERGHVPPPPHSSRPRHSLSSRGVGGSRCLVFGLTPE